MRQTMEEYHESNESEDKRSWIWNKAISVGKKVLTAGVVVSSAPLLFPPLVVASTIAFFSSVPFCLFLANYACTQKLMSSLLPSTEETGDIDKDDEYSGFEYSKLGHREVSAGVGEAALFMPTDEPIPIQTEEDDEEMAKESTSLLEKIRDESRNDRGNDKSEEIQDQSGKQETDETAQEGELGTTTTETSTGKDEETSSNEVYSEEQIWEKMETLRKVVGYSVARSATCAEELKALFVFTGVVEPPRSSLNQDTHDNIAHVTIRLRFLMSVIGIN